MHLAQTTATDRTKVTLPRGSSILLPCILTVYYVRLNCIMTFYNSAHAQTVFPRPSGLYRGYSLYYTRITVINIRLLIITGVLKNTPHRALSDI